MPLVDLPRPIVDRIGVEPDQGLPSADIDTYHENSSWCGGRTLFLFFFLLNLLRYFPGPSASVHPRPRTLLGRRVPGSTLESLSRPSQPSMCDAAARTRPCDSEPVQCVYSKNRHGKCTGGPTVPSATGPSLPALPTPSVPSAGIRAFHGNVVWTCTYIISTCTGASRGSPGRPQTPQPCVWRTRGALAFLGLSEDVQGYP